MRKAGPIVLLLVAGGAAFALSWALADPSNYWHFVIIGVVSLISSMTSSFFWSATKKHEELSRVDLDSGPLDKLKRQLARRASRLQVRFWIAWTATVVAFCLSVGAWRVKPGVTPAHYMVDLGYGCLVISCLVMASLAWEHAYLSKQLRELERLAEKRKAEQRFYAEMTPEPPPPSPANSH